MDQRLQTIEAKRQSSLFHCQYLRNCRSFHRSNGSIKYLRFPHLLFPCGSFRQQRCFAYPRHGAKETILSRHYFRKLPSTPSLGDKLYIFLKHQQSQHTLSPCMFLFWCFHRILCCRCGHKKAGLSSNQERRLANRSPLRIAAQASHAFGIGSGPYGSNLNYLL